VPSVGQFSGISKFVLTGTPLDGWVGGLPEQGLTQVVGPQMVGKSTFLLALAEGIRDHDPGLTILTVTQTNDQHLVSPRSWVVGANTLEELARKLGTNRDADVLLIDDAPSYPSESGGLASASRAWGTILQRERDQRKAIVMTGTMRRAVSSTPQLVGLAATFMADLIIELKAVARTRAFAGMVVEATVKKSKTGSPESLGKQLLWLRPTHRPSMILA